MNHPPKKKHKNPLLPEDQQVDDRNLINVEDSASLSFEDRVHLYLSENKGFLTACTFALLIVIVGYQVMRMVKDQAEATIKAEYAEADASDTLAEFASTHGDHALGGFAALKLADEAYTAGDYTEALELYSSAAAALKDPVFAGRARVGQAFALYKSGNEEAGLAELNAITSDTTLAESMRTEAAYHLAIEAHTAGRMAEFTSYAAQVSDSEFAVQWQQRLEQLGASGAEL